MNPVDKAPEMPSGTDEVSTDVDVRAELLALEASLGSTPQTKAASACLRALARASRAYLIYDPANEVIKTFLEDVQGSFGTYLADFSDLDLAVRPFEFLLDGEVVYRERDWERSLAFKLFRDGVRRLTVRRGVTWEELTQFLAILSIRYVGVHLDEDDVLTLLWKASFKHIVIEAVEGFVPTDDEDDLDLAATGAALGEYEGGYVGARTATARAPADFDLPAPELTLVEPPHYFAVAEEARAELRAEYGSPQLPADLVQLVDALVDAVEDPGDPMRPSEAAPFLTEVRDFLLNEDEIALLVRVARRIARGRGGLGADPVEADDRSELDALVDGFTSVRSLRRILATVPPTAEMPPPAYRELLDLQRGDSLQTLFELLDVERGPAARRFTRQLIERHLPARVEDVIRRFQGSPPAVAADLLRVLASRAEERTRALLNDVVHSGAPEVKLEFLSQIGGMGSQNQRAFLVLLLNAPEPEVRVRALDVVGGLGERGGWQPVFKHLQTRLAEGAADEELDALGRALARIDPELALEQFVPLASKKGLFHRVRVREVRGRRVAVSALCTLAHRAEAQAALKATAAGADGCAELARAALHGPKSAAPRGGDRPSPRAAPRPAPGHRRSPPPRGRGQGPRGSAPPRRTSPPPRPVTKERLQAVPEGDARPPWERSRPGTPVPQPSNTARAQLEFKAPSSRPPPDAPLGGSPSGLPAEDPLTCSFEFEMEVDDSGENRR